MYKNVLGIQLMRNLLLLETLYNECFFLRSLFLVDFITCATSRYPCFDQAWMTQCSNISQGKP